MASIIIRRESGSADRTVSVVSGGRVVASRNISEDEFRSARRSSSGSAQRSIDLANLALEDVEPPESGRVALSDPRTRQSRLLSPFESSAAVGLSTEQGDAVVLPSRDVRVYGIEEPSTRQSRLLSSAEVSRLSSTQQGVSVGSPLAVPAQRLSQISDTFVRPVSSVSLASDSERRGLRRSQSFADRVFRSAGASFFLASPSRQRDLLGFNTDVLRGDLTLQEEREVFGRTLFPERLGFALGSVGSIRGLRASTSASRSGLRALGAAESRLLSYAPRGLVRGGAAVGLATVEGQLIGRASRAVDIASAPERLRPFVSDNEAFRFASEAELSGEPNFFRRQLAGLNVGFSRQDDDFSAAAREFYESRGFSRRDVNLAVEGLEFRRSRQSRNQLFTTLNAGRFAEVVGRTNLAGFDPSGLSRSRVFGRVFRDIFPAGVSEVRGELAGSRARVGSDLPFIDSQRPFRSLLPSVSFDSGFSVDFRSQLGEDIALGALGGTVAGALGGGVGAGLSSPSSRGRFVGRALNVFGNVLDPSEPFTDFLAFDVALSRSPGVAYTPSPSRNRGFVPVDSLVPSARARSPAVVSSTTDSISDRFRSFFGVQSSVSSRSLSSENIIPSFPVSPQSRADIPSFPVSPQPTVPSTTPTQSFANVPATSFLPRLPVTPPFLFDLGSAGRVGRRGARIDFVNELSAALDVVGGRRIAFPDPLAGFNRGGRRA